jgi:hypothetical protein
LIYSTTPYIHAYNVFNDKYEQVGDVRLKGDYFCVLFPDYSGKCLIEDHLENYAFDNKEIKMKYLIISANIILKEINNDPKI